MVLFSVAHDLTEREFAEKEELEQMNKALRTSHEQLHQEIGVRLQAEAALRESRRELKILSTSCPMRLS